MRKFIAIIYLLITLRRPGKKHDAESFYQWEKYLLLYLLRAEYFKYVNMPKTRNKKP